MFTSNRDNGYVPHSSTPSDVRWSVLTYNTMLTVPEPIRFNGQNQRAKAIPEAVYTLHMKSPIDVVVFNELISQSDATELLHRLSLLGWRHQSQTIPYAYTKCQFLSGGVYIVSRYPIVAHGIHVFSSCSGVDCLVSKGVVYCEIVKDDQHIHIFGTHLQAWNTLGGRTARHSQLKELATFMRFWVGRTKCPVLLCGDLNIDRYSQSEALESALTRLGMCFPTDSVRGHPYTVDPASNTLVGNDDPSMYTSVSHPNGCYDEYMSTLHCVCCKPEWLDYILYSTTHLQPSTCHIRAIRLRCEPYDMRFSATITRQHQDLSDHFPLLANFTFPRITSSEKLVVNTRGQWAHPADGIHDIFKSLVIYIAAICIVIPVYRLWRANELAHKY